LLRVISIVETVAVFPPSFSSLVSFVAESIELGKRRSWKRGLRKVLKFRVQPRLLQMKLGFKNPSRFPRHLARFERIQESWPTVVTVKHEPRITRTLTLQRKLNLEEL
jgi:hypothetical protein